MRVDSEAPIVSLAEVNQRIREVYVLGEEYWTDPTWSIEKKALLSESLGALLKRQLKRPVSLQTPADDLAFHEAACALTKGVPSNRHGHVAAHVERLGEVFWLGLRVCQFMPVVEARWYQMAMAGQRFSSQQGDLFEDPPPAVAQATAPLLQPLCQLLREHAHMLVPCSITDQAVEADVPYIGYGDDYREIRRFLFPLYPD